MSLYACGPDGKPLTYRATVWKYELEVRSLQPVAMPQGARPLSAQWQEGKLVMCVLVKPDAPVRDYWIGVLGTGLPADMSPRWRFVDTVQEPDRSLVWHVFFDDEEGR